MIPRQQYFEELEIREKQLIEELKAIRVILGKSASDIPDSIPDSNIPSNKVAASGTPKGKMSWETYIALMLKEIGGKGKSQDVAQAVYKANPKIDEARILHAVRHHLSKLLKYEKIGATKNEIKSEGYEYYIKS